MEYIALVADDEADNRDIFKACLEQAGYDVIVEAVDGREALALLAEQTFHLLVLDLRMPHVDGIQVLHDLKQDARHDAMPVIVITANPHMRDETLDLADHVMYKPIDPKSLVAFLKRMRDE